VRSSAATAFYWQIGALADSDIVRSRWKGNRRSDQWQDVAVVRRSFARVRHRGAATWAGGRCSNGSSSSRWSRLRRTARRNG